MPERTQPLPDRASGGQAPALLPFLLRGDAGGTEDQTEPHAILSGTPVTSAVPAPRRAELPRPGHDTGPLADGIASDGPGGFLLEGAVTDRTGTSRVAAGDGAATGGAAGRPISGAARDGATALQAASTAADGMAVQRAASVASDRAAALQAAGAASVEAAATAVARAAAAVEAAAGTVQSAAAAVDMAAAALAFAGASARSSGVQTLSLRALPVQDPSPLGQSPQQGVYAHDWSSKALYAQDLYPHDLCAHDLCAEGLSAQALSSDFAFVQALSSPVIAPEAASVAAPGAELGHVPNAAPEALTSALLAPPRWSAALAGATSAGDPRARFRRVAIIHYWLVTMRGGERVLERLLQLFPGADIFTHVYDPAAMSDAIRAHTVRTSFIQKLPGARRHYQAYLPLMPLALEQLDLRGYDLVISSESGPAKGVIAAPDALHMCYVHSPMRYLWDHYHDYRNEAGWLKRAAMPLLCHGLRQWDTASAARVDRILANSNFIRERVAKAWRREAEVVHPPVDPALFTPSGEVEPGYLWVGQLVPYKRADLAIDAFNALGLPLTVVGDGPQAATLRKRAGPTIRMIPRLNFDELRRAYARCRALVFTAEEDFGIVPVEVMASGRPVIAYGRGGALDSVVAERTGLFFAEQTPEALIEAVRRLEGWLPHFDPAAALARARDFAPEHFDRGVLAALGR